MRMPHLMLIVVFFLGIITLLAHQPQGDKALAEETTFLLSNKIDMAEASEDVVRQCREQARDEHVDGQDMNAFIEECAASKMISQRPSE